MNAGATTKRVLADLRQRLTGEDFRPGDRLDPRALAGQLAASATPVREALLVLTGEGLVEAPSNGGFNLPPLDEIGLLDRYAWSQQILDLSIHDWPRRRKDRLLPDDSHRPHLIADRACALFMAIARHSHNSEHRKAVGLLNSRMRRIRFAESRVLEGLDIEMADMEHAFEASDRAWMLRLVQAYHRTRQKMSTDILRLTCSHS